MNIIEGEKDQRKAVRINSRILFAAYPVSNEQYQQIKCDFDNGITLYNREELADARLFIGAQSALARLKERDEDMAIFLQHIDAKINMLLKKIAKQPSIMDNLRLQSVNIAGNGLAFWGEEVYAKGDYVECHIVLPSINMFIDCFGKVVECKPEKICDQTKQRVSVHFCMIMEEDREELVHYNFKQQSLVLQRRRMEQEDK